MKSLFDKRLLLVTGKGGVGRTTLAAALALAAPAQAQQKVKIGRASCRERVYGLV